jgi:cysteine desulfurase/selenocysteine lyase
MNIEKIRSDFPILTQRINGYPLTYLDNSATTQKPQQVIDSIISFFSTYNSNVHRSGYALSEQASTLYESSRKKVHEYIKAKHAEEIIFTTNTTEAINLVATSFGKAFVSKDDEIIISEMEHHSNIVPWQQLCKEKKAVLKILPFSDDGVLIVDELERLLTKKTKMIALSFVSNTLGSINPVKEIIRIAHDQNVPVLIDGAQAVQHFPINVQDLDCDFFVFSGHKMYAEPGVGVLYAKQSWLNSLSPIKFGGGMVDRVSFENTTFSPPPLKFEAGTGNISAVISLGSAIDYIKKIGINHIKKHEDGLLTYGLNKLQSLDGLTIYGDSPERCGLISFNIKKVHHFDAMMILDKFGIAVRSGKHCAEPVMDHYNISGAIRASFAVYNTEEEIDRLIKGLKKVQEMHK